MGDDYKDYRVALTDLRHSMAVRLHKTISLTQNKAYDKKANEYGCHLMIHLKRNSEFL